MEAARQEAILRPFTHLRPHVALEYDSAKGKVVAARSQVGLSEMQSLEDPTEIPPGSHSHARLVDGFDIPRELLELPNLNDILSMETWETCLTEAEREVLSMYLPQGVDVEFTVEALLSGENLHFGNLLQTWGESVCAGGMHPDALLHRALKLKQQRKDYSKRLGNYHGNMVQNLQKMKEIWEECENSDDFLPQIQRSATSGQPNRGSLIKNATYPLKRFAENSNAKKRQWDEKEDLGKDMSTRPEPKKRKVNKPPEDGAKRLKVKPQEDETMTFKKPSVEEPKRLKIKPTEEVKDIPTRPKAKGGKVNSSQEGTKTLKINNSEDTKRLKILPSEEGIKRLKVRPSEEGTKRVEVKPSDEGAKRFPIKSADEGTRRLKVKPSEGGTNRLHIKPTEGSKKLESKPSVQGTKALKSRSTEEGTKRLKIKPAGDGAKRQEIKSSEEGMKRLQTKVLDEENDFSTRPKAKRPKAKLSAEGTVRLESKLPEERTKKSQIKLTEVGRKVLQIKPSAEERDLSSRPRAKQAKVKPSEQEGTKKQRINPSGDLPKNLKPKPSEEGPKVLKIKPSEDGMKVLKLKSLGEGAKRPNLKRSEGGAQKPKIKPSVEEDLDPRPKGRRQKVEPPKQGTKRGKSKPSEKGQDQLDLANSDSEGEWFKKYVRVRIAPISSRKLAKSIQSVKVTSRMFNDVKRRSEAGEEVHLDTLDPEEGRASDLQPSRKAGGLSGNEPELISSFWRTVLLKDLPIVHANFMERKAQQQKVAMHLAGTCKHLWEIEVDDLEDVQANTSPSRGDASPSEGEASQSGGDASSSGGDASPSGGDSSPSGGDTSPSGGNTSPSGGEASPSGGEASPRRDEPSQSGGDTSPSGSGGDALQSGGEASPTGGEALPGGDERWQSGDEASPDRDEALSGEEALPSGDDASQIGDETPPSEADLENDLAMISRFSTLAKYNEKPFFDGQ